MKKTIVSLVLLLPLTSFAQSNSTTGSASAISGSKKLGLYVGAEYMNITDVKTKFELKGNYRFSDGSRESKDQGGTHLGMAGLRIGYKKISNSKIGFDGAVRLMESFNNSEYGSTKLQMIVPEANLVFAPTSLLSIYGGLNYAKWTGSSAVNDYKPMVGVQTGLGLQFNSELALNAGYIIMREKAEDQYGDLTLEAGAFNTSVTYTF